MTSAEITKIIADTFYITYLPEDEKEYQSYIDFLERYINNSQFDRLRFIHDAKKCNENEKKSNLYEHLLPIKDLRQRNSAEKNIKASFGNNFI